MVNMNHQSGPNMKGGFIAIFIACSVIAAVYYVTVYLKFSSSFKVISETESRKAVSSPLLKSNGPILSNYIFDTITPPEPVTASAETLTSTPATLSKLVATSSETVGTSESRNVESVQTRGWDSGSFCDDLLHKTFSHLVPVCTTGYNEQSAIICKRTLKSTRMIECSMRNVLIRPKKLFNGIISGHVVNSEGVELLENDLVSCKSPNIQEVYRTTESNDHTRHMVEESLHHPPSLKRSDCQRWISEPTLSL